MPRSDRTARPAASQAPLSGPTIGFSPFTLAAFALAGGGTNFSVANGGTGRSDLFQAGAFVRHTVGAAYVTGVLAYDLVRLQISLRDLSPNLFGAGDDAWRGQQAHSANFGVKLDQCSHFRFFVQERIGIALRGGFDEFLIKVLAATSLVYQPLQMCLGLLGKPSRKSRCKPTYGGSYQTRESRDN